MVPKRNRVPGRPAIPSAEISRPSGARPAACLALCACLAACAVGPDYRRPATPAPSRYTEAPQPGHTGGTSAEAGGDQRFVSGQDIQAAWWDAFHSPALSGLVARALAKNPSLEAAQQSLHQAQENTLAQSGAFLPQVTGQFNRTREELSGAESGSPSFPPQTFSIYGAQLNVSYTFDVWGLTQRSVEADRAREADQRFQLEGATTMLAANTASTAILTASLAAQIEAEQALVEAERALLRTVRSQFQLGAAAGADVATQEAQLANTEALVVPLQTQLAQARHQLAAYTGEVPAEAAIPVIALTDLTLPADLPVSLPSQLVEQRPDIRASEAQLQVATAGVGIAVANRLPQLTLSGFVGTAPAKIGQLFQPGNGTFTLLSQLLGPVFEGGTLLHQQRAAVAAARGAAATYRNTVVTAFQNVADVLTALTQDARALEANQAAERAAARSLSLAQSQYGAGGIAYLTVLTAQTQYQNAVIGLIRAQAARFSDTVALFAALGGGWWNRHDVAPSPEGFWKSLAP